MARAPYGHGSIDEIVKDKKYYIRLSIGRNPMSERVYTSPGNVPDDAYAIDERDEAIKPRVVYGKATDAEREAYDRWKTPRKYSRKSEMFYGTKRQAQLRIEEIRREATNGARPDADKVTYRELSDEFISREEKHGINCRTGKPLRTATKNDLRTTEKAILRVSWFSSMRIVDITAGDLLRLYDEMRESGTGAMTVAKAHKQIDRVMRYAVKNRIVTFNPCMDLEKREVPAKPKPNRRRLTEEQFENTLVKLLANQPSSRNAAVVVAFCTGMRRGEVLGLQWKHVDFDNRTISVQQQLTKEGELHETKADEKHIIPLDAILADYLMRWKSIQASYFDSLNADGGNEVGDPYRIKQTSETPVITDACGQWYNPKNFSKWYREWCVENGLGHWEDETGRVIVELTIGDDSKPFDNCLIEWRDAEGWPCDDAGRRYSRTYKRPKVRRHYVGTDFHALRRTFFTLRMADQDNPCDLKTLQALGGWSTPDMLLNVYATSMEQRVKASGGFIDNMLSKRDDDNDSKAS